MIKDGMWGEEIRQQAAAKKRAMTKSTESNTGTSRHPLAIAWEEWINSLDGARCSNLDTLREEKHLVNRLHHAYDAAYDKGQSQLAEKVLAELNERFNTGDVGRGIIVGLRNLFKRLNVEVGGE